MVVPGATRSLMFIDRIKAWLTPAWYFSARLWNHAGGARGLLSMALALVQVGMRVYLVLLDLGRIFRAVGFHVGDVGQGHLLPQRGEQGFNGRFAPGEGAIRHLGLD